MGLSRTSTGKELMKSENTEKSGFTVALAGNPNVGKSTVFNLLTGMHQHTGNWPGKTVSNARGNCEGEKRKYELVDIPGAYSLCARSEEERIARDFICFGNADAVVLVCDGGCLERNLNLVLQCAETEKDILICVNLMDEAKRKGIKINLKALSEKLGLPVIGISAKNKNSRDIVLKALDALKGGFNKGSCKIEYPEILEEAIINVEKALIEVCADKINPRWLALRLLEADRELKILADEKLSEKISENKELMELIETERERLRCAGIEGQRLQDMIASAISEKAREIASDTVFYTKSPYSLRDRKIDKLLTGKLVGYPLMVLLLLLVFYITITGANYPSEMLSKWLFTLEDKLRELFIYINLPPLVTGLLLDGVYRVLAWVVSVMLPPMAIFFPLFTLLEDAGYLPRIAYNLDKPFSRCGACGKQALSMSMGFGCNAAGVIGCRIIDSERERLLAVITNSLVPCNGRFPLLIAIISMFFAGTAAGKDSPFLSALMLTGFIVLSVIISFGCTKLLSSTVLKGKSSAFVLEMPPYRKPDLWQLIVRSIFDRTLFVLGRAVAVAAPAGAILWLMAHVQIYGNSLMNICSGFLEPLGRFMGLDGVILIAFILGFPANEIVLPIIIMGYTAAGSITEPGSLVEISRILTENGWTWITAFCTMLFSLFHWPCSTTLLTIKKETGSRKWTALSMALPTAVGFILCSLAAHLFSLI